LIDERRTRRIAKQLEIPVIGSGAILIELKKQKQIASVKPALFAWQAHGYFLADGVISDILKAANESEINPP
jgi:predicted nucleic acid-binding protein